MPSPRKGGTTPIRRRRKPRTGPRASPPAPAPTAQNGTWRPGRRVSAGSVESNSSWVDTTDTSLVTTSSSPGSRSSYGDSSPSPSSSSTSSWSTVSSSSTCSSSSSSSSEDTSSSSSGSGSDGDGSSEDDSEDADADKRRRAREGRCGQAGPWPSSAPRDKRGRSWSRRGARERGGSVLCRYCGRRGYGVMKLVFSCCQNISSASCSSGSEGTPESCRSPAGPAQELRAPTVPSPAPALEGCPSPRYNWSPCSSDSSSSTLSEDGAVSSGDDADVEDVPLQLARTHLPLLHHSGHVAVS